MVPLDPAVVNKEYVKKWASGDPKVVLEIESLVLSKDPNVTVRDIPTLKELMEAHQGGYGVKIIVAQQNLKTRAVQLEEGEFELKFSHMQYDCEAFKVHLERLNAFESRIYQKQLEWNKHRHEKGYDAASAYLSIHSCIQMFVKSEDVPIKYCQLLDALEKEWQMSRQNIVTLAPTNWTAPCTMKSCQLEMQANMIAMLANQQARNICPIL